ncbi:MAG TPA: FAD-dependent monooxygenase [Steroidobacteraceae bacterium]
MSETFDVLIVGGGPVGACAAALLARGSAHFAAPLRVAVLDPHDCPAPEPDSALDARVVALSRASERILRSAGAWERVHGPRICAYERMRVWHESVAADCADVLLFDAADAGEANLGYIAENRLVQAALLQALTDAGAQIVCAQFQSLRIGTDAVHVLSSAGSLSTRLLVGADGAQSTVRESVGLTAEIRDYHQLAMIATVATERPHASTAWQRFMRQGTLAMLPLADGHSSIVWSADEALAATLMAASPQQYSNALTQASDLALGDVTLVSERSAFPLRQLAAHRYVAQRCALIGDAAHVVHPLAGQGLNLGLLDAAALAQCVLDKVQEREDPGALRGLRAYERWRKSELAVMSAAIDAFDRLLAHGAGPVSRLAQRGLGWVNRSSELKRLFIRRALGLTGELPRAAR